MNIKRARIISWMGKSSVLEKRLKAHNKQIDWLIERDIKPVVFTQEWKEEWYRSGVEYIKWNGPRLFPGAARNFLLEHLYNSDENFSIFADDDSILYDNTQHCDGKDFIDIFNKIDIKDLNNIDSFLPISPRQSPFTEMYKRNEDKLKKYLWFKLAHRAKGSWFVLRNMKKFYDKEYYIKDELFVREDGSMVGGEDNHFVLSLLNDGYGCYELQNIILNEITSSNSTWVDDDSERMSDDFHRILKKSFNLPMKGNRLDFSVIKMVGKKPREVFVSKIKENEFFDL